MYHTILHQSIRDFLDLMLCLAMFFPLFKVPFHIDGGQPSYLIIAGLVFTPLSEPLIEYVVFIRHIWQYSFFFFFYNLGRVYSYFWCFIIILLIIKPLAGRNVRTL